MRKFGLEKGWRGYKKEPVSTALSVYHSILRLTPLLPWGEGGKQIWNMG
jgi:hypothetical protein